MQKFLLLALFVIITRSAYSQTLPDQAMKVNIGRGKLGTGDIQGLMLGVEYERFFQKRLSWLTELGMTIHDGSDLLLVTEANGKVHDLSYRYTTAGAQLVGKMGYHFLRTTSWDLGIRVGGLFRYQSSSVPNDRTTIFPIVTGLPLPVYITEHTSSQRTYSFGGISQFFAGYTINQKIILGLTTGLQLDTNGDTIFPQLSFTIGRRF
ncbi:hypothetical protein ACFP1I_00235 [Dyadobacter subterraneus]|uniref:Outer membrane protein beta-barrel domain-containing protein n=1 Tax=Dyadobacter subterraneus TaxID=2773304 RepID=A0ABR9WMD2_9BACT|nr:hypothetical protein [Dyadobacter subterraneus]MBE9466036.1 hypothetical protein [Dyadobacter subterraneus]